MFSKRECIVYNVDIFTRRILMQLFGYYCLDLYFANMDNKTKTDIITKTLFTFYWQILRVINQYFEFNAQNIDHYQSMIITLAYMSQKTPSPLMQYFAYPFVSHVS